VSEPAPLRGGTRDTAERISALNRRDRHEGSDGFGSLRLGKQTLCQLSYSRSGGGGTVPCAGEVTTSEPLGVAGVGLAATSFAPFRPESKSLSPEWPGRRESARGWVSAWAGQCSSTVGSRPCGGPRGSGRKCKYRARKRRRSAMLSPCRSRPASRARLAKSSPAIRRVPRF
jgi:hypothetical protein